MRSGHGGHIECQSGTGAGVTIGLLVLACEDAERLPLVLSRLPGCLDEVLLVDEGSVDDTVAVMRAVLPGARTLISGPEAGPAALEHGLESMGTDIVVCLEPDGTSDPADIPAHLAVLLEGADCTRSTRFAPSTRARRRRPGEFALDRVARLVYGVRWHDVAGGCCAFWRDRSRLLLDTAGPGASLPLRAARAGLSVCTVPTHGLGVSRGSVRPSEWQLARAMARTVLAGPPRPAPEVAVLRELPPAEASPTPAPAWAAIRTAV